MLEDMEHVFRVGIDCPANFLTGFAFAPREFFTCRRLNLKQPGSGLLSGFDAGLMIGIDVDKRAVKSNRAFVERDQRANAEGVRFWNTDRDRFAILFVKRCPRSAKKTMQIVATGDPGLDVEN